MRKVRAQLGTALNRAQINAILQPYSQNPDSEFYKSIIEGYIDQTAIGELLKIGLDEYNVAFRAIVLLSVRFSPEILPLVDKILPDKTMYCKEVSIGYIWPDWPKTTIENQRGAHFVDPEGKRETSLSKEYQSYAKAANSKGFSRFAETMLAIAEDYARETQENKKAFGSKTKSATLSEL